MTSSHKSAADPDHGQPGKGHGTVVPGAALEQVQVEPKGDVWIAENPGKGHRVCVSAPRAISGLAEGFC